MKRRVILLSLILSAIVLVPAMASVTTEQLSEPEFLMNQGYSQQATEDVYVLKNRALGNPAEPLYQKNRNAFVKGWRAFWGYVDPARDEADRIHHDVQPSPSYKDL